MNPVYFSASFESSADDPRRCPPAVAEVAFAGRSNAGKSSAINAITRNGKLARTSKTPGRTQLINHFALGEGRFLVDLPGYGYAQVSKARQRAWQVSLSRYLVQRDCLRGLVMVMDIRHPLTDADWTLIDLQQQGGSGLHVVLTKSDKVARSARKQTLERVRRELEDAGIEATLQDFSALKQAGVADVHTVLDAWLFDKPLPVD